jgi:hypothetical protein
MTRYHKIGGRLFQTDSNWGTKEAARTQAASIRLSGIDAVVKSKKMPWGETHHFVYKR